MTESVDSDKGIETENDPRRRIYDACKVGGGREALLITGTWRETSDTFKDLLCHFSPCTLLAQTSENFK